MEILLASNNKNKHKELLKIFQEFGSKHTLIVNKDIPDVIEDKNTIEENAKKKAEECYKVFKSPIISDDSGLFVDALDGQPGVHSKRYAGLSSTDVENNQKLINELKTADNLNAFFKTVLCYFDGLNFITSEGVLKGNIILEPRGKNGFGYDPIFDVNGKTLAEMTLEEKSNISHRKIAAVKLVGMLNEHKV
jgi:XTP/dITP diphosphohydrolase